MPEKDREKEARQPFYSLFSLPVVVYWIIAGPSAPIFFYFLQGGTDLTPNLQKLRYTYLLLYTLGGVCTLMTLALLIWVAVCIALEAEPLAAISFLSHLPTPLRFVIIIAVMAISIAAWQYGAKYHQQYEAALKQRRTER